MKVRVFSLFHHRTPSPSCTFPNWQREHPDLAYPRERALRIWETKLLVPESYELRPVGVAEVNESLQLS